MPRITLEITVDRCREIIGEAGSRYWAQDYIAEFAVSKCVLTVLQPNGRGENDVKAKHTRVDADAIAKALKRMIEGKAGTNEKDQADAARIAGRVLAGGGDTLAYDCVLQVAVFDSIVYG